MQRRRSVQPTTAANLDSTDQVSYGSIPRFTTPSSTPYKGSFIAICRHTHVACIGTALQHLRMILQQCGKTTILVLLARLHRRRGRLPYLQFLADYTVRFQPQIYCSGMADASTSMSIRSSQGKQSRISWITSLDSRTFIHYQEPSTKQALRCGLFCAQLGYSAVVRYEQNFISDQNQPQILCMWR